MIDTSHLNYVRDGYNADIARRDGYIAAYRRIIALLEANNHEDRVRIRHAESLITLIHNGHINAPRTDMEAADLINDRYTAGR
jgi:hypothetical protein